MENNEKGNDQHGKFQNFLDDLRKSIENLSVGESSENIGVMEATEIVSTDKVTELINEERCEKEDNDEVALIGKSELESRIGNRQSPEVTIDEVAQEAIVEEEEPVSEETQVPANEVKRSGGSKTKVMLGAALTGRKPRPPAPTKRSFTEQELIDLRTAFDLLDRDRDGRVTASELQFMLKKLGIQVRDELIDDLLKEASQTGNGLIDEAEFLTWVGRIQSIQNDAEAASSQQEEDDDLTQDLIAAFRVFDRDGNGFITRDELQTAMDMIGEHLTETQLNELLSIADLDKDGRINYEEFKIWFKSYLE